MSLLFSLFFDQDPHPLGPMGTFRVTWWGNIITYIRGRERDSVVFTQISTYACGDRYGPGWEYFISTQTETISMGCSFGRHIVSTNWIPNL